MPEQSFSQFMQSQAPPTEAAPKQSFGDFMAQQAAPTPVAPGAPAQPVQPYAAQPAAQPAAPTQMSGLPHPDVVDALTSQHAQTLATAVTAPAPLNAITGLPQTATPGGGGMLAPVSLAGGEAWGQPLMNFGAAMDPKNHGIIRGLADFASGLTSPENLALLGPIGALGKAAPLLGRLISLGFSGQMLHGVYQQVPEFRAALDRGDFPMMKEIATKMVAGTAMGGLALLHGARGEPPKPGGAAPAPTATITGREPYRPPAATTTTPAPVQAAQPVVAPVQTVAETPQVTQAPTPAKTPKAKAPRAPKAPEPPAASIATKAPEPEPAKETPAAAEPPAQPVAAPPAKTPVELSALPVDARRAIHEESMMRRTNEGGGIDSPDPYEGVRWETVSVPLESLKPRNEMLWGDKFRHRGSMTKGPIVQNDRGEIIDGNNRLYEAIQRGDKEIEVIRPHTAAKAPEKKPATPQVAHGVGGEGTKYVLPTFATAGAAKGEAAVARHPHPKLEHPLTYFSGKDSPLVQEAAKRRGDIGLMVTPLKPDLLFKTKDYPAIAIDNGVFSTKRKFNPERFLSLIRQAAADPEIKAKVQFVVAPDVVGDADATLKLYKEWEPKIHKLGFPVAFVAQNGLENRLADIPWDKIDTLFVGGTTEWKEADLGQEADKTKTPAEQDKHPPFQRYVKIFDEAERRGIPVHTGRVNSWRRMEGTHEWLHNASTVDGTYLTYGEDKNLPKLEKWLDLVNKPSPEETPAAPAKKAKKPATVRAEKIRDAVKAGTPYKEAVAQVDAEAKPAKPEPKVEMLDYRGTGKAKRDFMRVYVRQHPEGWEAEVYGELGGLAGGDLGNSGYEEFHPTRQAAIDAAVKSATRHQSTLTSKLGSGYESAEEPRQKAMVQWLNALASKPSEETPTATLPAKTPKKRRTATEVRKIKELRADGMEYEAAVAKVDAEKGVQSQSADEGRNPPAVEGSEPAAGEGTGSVGGSRPSTDVGVRTGKQRVRGLHPGGTGGGPGAGTDTGDVDATAVPPPRVRQPKPVDTRPRLTGYRITAADRLGEGSLSDKALQNIEAIKTLKHVEGEARPATVEEQRTLVKYTGWGALSEVFEHYQTSATMRSVRAELQELLTPEEWKTAAATTPNAHYTSEAVTRAMWDAATRLGIKAGAATLEPSMGSGNFFGLMPDALLPNAKLAGVELDPVTARIAALLYPNVGTHAMGFEKTRFPDNWFDLAISNVPFGNYGIHDAAFKGERRIALGSIHNYFFAKALDKVRPGGIIAFITSRYTMDQKSPAFREYMAKEAKFLGAIRLPQTAFEKNAGTTVVTDMIFLQKRVPGDASENEPWAVAWPTKLFPDDIDNPTQNEYYDRHPEMILGTVKGNRGRFGPELNVLGELDPQKLAAAIARLPENVVTEYKTADAFKPDAIAIAEYPEAGKLKQGAYGVHDGKIVRRHGEMLEPATLPKETAQRVTGMIGVRDAMHEVFRAQLADKPEAELKATRKELGKVYDKFVSRFGALHDRANVKAFQSDPDAQPILALEKLDKATKTVAKTDIFTEPTLQTYRPVASVDTPKEALTISLNEYGRINWPRMSQLTGLDAVDLQADLGDLVYHDPATGAWVPADEYLSGDVRQKLAQAKDIAKTDPAFARNITALEAAKPVDLEPGEIVARLGAPWIPPRVVGQFMEELLGNKPGTVSVAYSPAIATWRVVMNEGRYSPKNTAEFAGGDIPAHELIEQAMNMKVPQVRVEVGEGKTVVDPKATAAAQDMQQKLKDRFKTWVWESPTRSEKLAKLYNETYNGIRLREYDGSHLTLKGSNPAIELRPHQKNAIWRTVSAGRNTLLAHVVGAGKTFEMIGSAMELRRLGLAKKPLLTVPANIVGQIGADFRLLYPAANILVADESTFNAKNRQNAMARVATGNWDAVVISHEAFGSLPIQDETFNAFLQKEIDTLEDAILESKAGQADKKIQKELEKSKKRLEAKLRKAADREEKDTGLTFEQLGVDALFVDEADLFKNLFFVTRATRIAGIPNSDSARAFDMLIKSRHVTDKTGGRLVFATGTPISNTVAEMYTMLRYLSPKELDARGLGQFDAWAQQFGESVTGLETSPDGAGFRVNTRFAKFSNLPELQNLFRQVADVQTADMLKLPVPKLAGGKHETISVPASQFLLDYIMAKDKQTGQFLPGSLMGRIAAIKTGRVDPREDNMLKVTSDGRKAALDLRLVGEMVDPPDSKVNMAVGRIFDIWKEGKAKRTAQMVFSDLSTPSDERWNVYDELRRKLTLRGVPADEIAFAHDAGGDTTKKKILFDKVNKGDVRIIIGSTGKMGAGTNAQERLIALHHLDVPWRPRDVEQREGRILRQGNTNPEVHIVRYVTAPSFDAYMWGMVTRKGKFINQVMTGKLGLREAEDIGSDSLGAAEAEAAATGNPLIKEKADVDNQVMRLSALQSEHARKQVSARIEAQKKKADIERAEIWIPRLEADIKTRDANTPDEFTMKVGKTTFDERKAAGEALNAFAVARRLDEEIVTAGKYRGFEIKVQGQGAERMSQVATGEFDANPPRLMFTGESTHYANLNPASGLGTLQSLDNRIDYLNQTLHDYRNQATNAKADLKQLTATAATPFADGALLDRLVARQRELINALDLGANQAPAVAEDSATGGSGEARPERSPEAGGATLNAMTFGLASFVEHDVAPALRDVAAGIAESAENITKVLLPSVLSKEAESGSLTLRHTAAELARKTDQAQAALENARRYFRKQPEAENFEFLDRMEHGRKQKNAQLDAIARVLRDLLDGRLHDVQALGTGKLQSWIEDYFPHIWERPERAFEAFFGKRPMEGRKSFLKQRKIPTIAEGRALGLKPVSDNPVDLALAKVYEMDKYVMAHKTLKSWKKQGIAKFFRGLKAPPAGWDKIDDSISTVYGRNAAGETVVRGHYYAPEGAARIMNNYLSPGLRKYAAYRGVAGLNNALNQFQLGLSAFHLGFTAADTTVSKAALGYQALLRGKPLKALRYFAQTPTAAFTTYLEGDKMLKEWYRPGSQGTAIGALVDAFTRAGGRARMPTEYRTRIGENMYKALRQGNPWGALIRAPFAGVEAISNLLMNEVVPRMKAGAFADLARFHLENMPAGSTYEDVSRALAQDQDSIDNRLGEMVYDNLFWNKIGKDLAHILVRSVGWNLGTLREVGGGIIDIAAQPIAALRGKPVNLNRLSYLLGLATVTAVVSAIYQYLKTGHGPEELEDYFFPKNGETDEQGRAQRVSLPTYVKDIYHYGTHPLKTLENKVAPIWSTFAEMIHNRDFYGTEIRHADDPLVQQLGQLAKHAAASAIPIGVRQYQRETKLGSSPATRAEQFIGITPAPSDLNASPAERMAREYSAARTPDEPRTAAAAERRELRQTLARALRQGKAIPQAVLDARNSGKLTARDIGEARRESRETSLQVSFTHLGIDEAIKVYNAATAKERAALRGPLLKKGRAAMANEAGAQRAATLEALRGALAQ